MPGNSTAFSLEKNGHLSSLIMIISGNKYVIMPKKDANALGGGSNDNGAVNEYVYNYTDRVN